MLLKNKQFYYYLFDLCLLETLEFIFCNDIVVEYKDSYIVVYHNEKQFDLLHPFIDDTRNMAFRKVTGKC